MILRLCAFGIGLSLALAAVFWLPRFDTPPTQFDVAKDLMARDQADLAVHLFEDPAWRGIAQYRAKRYNRALGDFFLTEDDPRSLYNMGTAYAQLEEWGGSIAAYEKVLLLEPGHVDAAHNLRIVKEAQDLARREATDVRTEKQLGRWKDGQKDQPQSGEDQQSENVETGEASKGPTGKGSSEVDKSGQSSGQGLAGEQKRSENTAAGTGYSSRSENAGTSGEMAGFSARTEALEAEMAAEILLRQITDDPAMVLQARLRTAHKLREEKRRGCIGC